MKYSAVMLAAAGLAAAQSPTDYFPTCALSCLEDAISADTTCSVTDYACQCTAENQASIQSGATSCVISACGADVAVSTVLPAATSFCAAVSAAASTSAAETTAAETTSSAVETSAAVTTSVQASGSSAAASATMATSTGKNGTAPSTPTPTAVVVSAAAGNSVRVLGGVAALFLAAVAAL